MADAEQPKTRAYVALGLGILGLGFSGIFVSLANAPGAVTGFYRMTIGLLVLAFPFFRRLKRIGKLPLRELRVALLAGVFFAGDLLFWASGVIISGPTNPTLMSNTAPLWVGLGALIFFREKLRPTFWIGLALAIAGAMIVLGLDALDNVGLGTFFGLMAGIFYGAYYLVIQRSRQRLDSLSAFWISGACAAVLLLLGALLLRQPLTGYSVKTYVNLLLMGLIVQAGGQLAISYALGYLPASIVSPTMLGQPILTALLAIPLLGDRLSLWQIIGGITVIAGVYVVHQGRGREGRLTAVSGEIG